MARGKIYTNRKKTLSVGKEKAAKPSVKSKKQKKAEKAKAEEEKAKKGGDYFDPKTGVVFSTRPEDVDIQCMESTVANFLKSKGAIENPHDYYTTAIHLGTSAYHLPQPASPPPTVEYITSLGDQEEEEEQSKQKKKVKTKVDKMEPVGISAVPEVPVTFWKEVKDPSSDRFYYWNPETNVTSWTLPPNAVIASDEAEKSDKIRDPEDEDEVPLGATSQESQSQAQSQTKPVKEVKQSETEAIKETTVEVNGYEETKKESPNKKSVTQKQTKAKTTGAAATATTTPKSLGSGKQEPHTLRLQVSSLSDEVKRKLSYLHVSSNKMSDLQRLYVQLETRLSDWNDGALTSRYVLTKLKEADKKIQSSIQRELPHEWQCSWDRASCRYYFVNHVTGEKLWEFPNVGSASPPSSQDVADGEEEEEMEEEEEEEEEYDDEDDQEIVEAEAPPNIPEGVPDDETCPAVPSPTNVECGEEEPLPAMADATQVTSDVPSNLPEQSPVVSQRNASAQPPAASVHQPPHLPQPSIKGHSPPVQPAVVPISSAEQGPVTGPTLVQPPVVSPVQPTVVQPSPAVVQPSPAIVAPPVVHPSPTVVQPSLAVAQHSVAQSQSPLASTNEEPSAKAEAGGFGFFGPKRVSPPPPQPVVFPVTDIQDQGAEDMDLDDSSPETEQPVAPVEEKEPRSSIPLYMSPPQSNEGTPQPAEAPPIETPPTEIPKADPPAASLYDDDLPPTKEEQKEIMPQEERTVPVLEEEEALIRARLIEKIKSKEENTELAQEIDAKEEKAEEAKKEEVKDKVEGEQQPTEQKESDKEEKKDRSSTPEVKKSKKDRYRDDRRHYDDDRDSYKSRRSKRHRDDYSDSDSDDYHSSSHKKHRRYRSRSSDRHRGYSGRSSKSSRSRRYSDDYSDDDRYSSHRDRHRSRSRDRYRNSKKKKKEKKSRHRHRSSSSEDDRSSRHESSRSKGKFRDRDTKPRDTSQKSTPPPMEKTFVPARFKPKKPQGDENGQQMLTQAQMEMMHNIASATGVYPVAYPIDAQQYANYAYYDPTQMAATAAGVVYSEPPPPPPPKVEQTDENQQSSSVVAADYGADDTSAGNAESQTEAAVEAVLESVQEEAMVVEKSEDSQIDSEPSAAIEKVAQESEVVKETSKTIVESEEVSYVAPPSVPTSSTESVTMDTEVPDKEPDVSNQQVEDVQSNANVSDTKMDVVASPPSPPTTDDPPTADALPSKDQPTPDDNTTANTDVSTASSDPPAQAPPTDSTPPLQEASNYTYSAPSTTYAYQYTDPNAYAAYAQAQAYYANPYTTTSAAAAVYDPNQYAAAAMNYYAAYQAAYTAGYGAYFQQSGSNGTQKK